MVVRGRVELFIFHDNSIKDEVHNYHDSNFTVVTT
jgi:hypothetical protein